MVKRSTSKRHRKTAKPHPDFPLFKHATGRWCKKVRSKFSYFGKVADDPEGQKALDLWLAQKDDLLAGRRPRVGREGLTVRDLLNQFLTSKLRLVESGEIVRRTFDNYRSTAKRIGDSFSLTRLVDDLAADDFGRLRAELAKQYGPQALAAEIQRTRTIFGFAYSSRLIKAPVPFGQDFRLPGKRLIRQARAAKGLRMFEADELRQILESATVPVKAMTLLGVNAGLGNHDCGQLPFSALDLENGWLTFPRAKTGIMRRVPLWPETIEALCQAIAERPEPKNPADSNIVFITRFGTRWVRARPKDKGGDVWVDSVAFEFRKVLTNLGIRRQGLNFYGLRHTFSTIGEETRDFPAVEACMGHSDTSMAAAYRERIGDDRLRAVVDHVRRWLFGAEETK